MIVQGITSTTEAKGNDDEVDVDHVAMYLCPVPHKKRAETRASHNTHSFYVVSKVILGFPQGLEQLQSVVLGLV